jgi:carbonic anhydrase/acetyltransferase-like protein (isoleucine patch superfamily)
MSIIKTLNGISPQFGRDCWLAETATVIGEVVMGNECSIWYNVVIRGDVNSITLGNKVNVQDGVVIHCSYDRAKTVIGNQVSIGHNAIIHGCAIHDHVLIGMGAIIMDNAVIHSNSIIAAGSVVLENSIVEEGSLYAGIPAKKVKNLDAFSTKENLEKIANNYVMYSKWYQK